MQRALRLLKRLFILLMLIPLFGCSSFNRDFESAVAARSNESEGIVEGSWAGRWISDAGHGSGKLRCILTRSSAEQYKARFEATFWGIFRGGYDVMLNAEEVEGVVKFEGEQDLGWLAGGGEGPMPTPPRSRA